jgi:hypothetical protein
LSESLSLSNGQLMSTLAGAASAFVDIMAGFYTTKVFSISTDKKRLEIEINDRNLQIQQKNEIVKSYELKRDKEIEEDEDEMIDSFITHISHSTIVAFKPLDSPDKIIAYFKELYEIETELSDRVIKKLYPFKICGN